MKTFQSKMHFKRNKKQKQNAIIIMMTKTRDEEIDRSLLGSY